MTPLRNLSVVCSVDDAPAVSLTGASEGDVVTDLRIKSLDTGRIYSRAFAVPEIRDDRAYVMVLGFAFGERVAIGFDTTPFDSISEWFNDDHEVGLGDFLAGRVACLQEPACNTVTEPQETPSEPLTACDDTQEAPEDLPEAEGPEDAGEGLHEGVTGCAAAELRTVLIKVMRTQDRAMTVREIAAILNSDTVDARTRIATVLADMEGKGLVKRGSYVPSQSPGRKSVTTWVVA